MTEQEINKGKTTAVVSYLFFIGLLIAWSMNREPDNRFASFHIRQSLGLVATYFLVMISTSYLDIAVLSLGFFVFFSVIWFYCLFQAAKGRMTPLPVLGNFFQSIFKDIH